MNLVAEIPKSISVVAVKRKATQARPLHGTSRQRSELVTRAVSVMVCNICHQLSEINNSMDDAVRSGLGEMDHSSLLEALCSALALLESAGISLGARGRVEQ